jgi:hypothetical protein
MLHNIFVRQFIEKECRKIMALQNPKTIEGIIIDQASKSCTSIYACMHACMHACASI